MDFQNGTTLPAPSDDRIEWFQTTYQVSLPREYIGDLRRGNGGVPLRRTFVHRGQERLIERMLCLMDNPKEDQVNGWYDLSVVLSQLDTRLIDDENLVGMNVIPIAVLFGGDFVCLDYRSSLVLPTVAVWDHDESEDFVPALDTLASSYTAFDGMLQ